MRQELRRQAGTARDELVFSTCRNISVSQDVADQKVGVKQVDEHIWLSPSWTTSGFDDEIWFRTDRLFLPSETVTYVTGMDLI